MSRAVPVESAEWGRVLPVLAANFLLIGGVIIGRNVRDSLFLKNFGIANLPYMYLASAVLVVACSSIYARFVSRLDRIRFLTVSFELYALLLTASTILLGSGARWVYPALYMLVQTIWILSVMQFWTAAGDMFDTRQAKRLFPFLASGGLLGMIGTGFVIRPAVRLFGTARLLLLWVVCLVIALVLLRLALARYRLSVGSGTGKKHGRAAPALRLSWTAEALEGFRLMRATRLVGVMAGIVLTLWVVFVLVDFQFNRVMNATYPKQDELTAFLGSFRAWAGFAALFVQLVLTPRLISRFGVGRTVLFHPTALVMLTGGLLARYGFASAFTAKFLDHVLLWSVQDASFQLLYNPLPPNKRARAVAFIDGSLKPLANGFAGLLLIIAATMHWSPWTISLAALILACVWLASASKVGGAYLEALLADLAGQYVTKTDTAAALAKLQDPESLERLFAAMKSATPAQALLAIHLLERLDIPKAQTLLDRLTDHPDPIIRATAVAALGRARRPALRELLSHVVTDDRDARVRANALALLESGDDVTPPSQRLSGGAKSPLNAAEQAAGPAAAPALAEKQADARELLLRYIEDQNRRVRANAIRTLGQLNQAEGSKDGEGELGRLLELCELMCKDPDSATRQAGAYAAGGLPTRLAQPLLLRLLSGPKQSPWKQELRTLAEVGDEHALEAILRAAEAPAAGHQAFRAVRHLHARRPAAVLARLLEIVRDAESVALRPQVLKALGQIDDPAALPALAELLQSPNSLLRAGALSGIDRLAEKHALPAGLVTVVRASAQEDTNRLARSFSYSRSIAAHLPAHAGWLEPFLSDEAARIQRRVFLALGVVTDRQRMASIARQLQPEAGRRERANALEALEFLGGPGLGRRLVRLLEGEELPEVPLAEVLERLAAHASPSIRACLACVIGQAELSDHIDLLERLRMCGEFTIREAALDSIWRLCGEDALPLITHALQDPHPAVRRLAEAIIGRKTMLLTVEKMLFLKSVPLFVSLEGDELVTLSEICAEREIAADAVVFREGDEGNDLYVIVAGKVRVFRGEGAGERQLAELGDRECFGEMALLDSEERSASVATQEPCHFLVIRGDDFRELILNHPKISLEILRLLSQRLRKADELPVSTAAYATGQGYV